VGLQEREGNFGEKFPGKGGIQGLYGEPGKEVETFGFRISQQAQPFPFMGIP